MHLISFEKCHYVILKSFGRELTIEYARTVATSEKVEKLEEIKMVIKKLRDITIEIVEKRLMLPKGSRAIEATELMRLVLKRFRQSFKTDPPPSNNLPHFLFTLPSLSLRRYIIYSSLQFLAQTILAAFHVPLYLLSKIKIICLNTGNTFFLEHGSESPNR